MGDVVVCMYFVSFSYKTKQKKQPKNVMNDVNLNHFAQNSFKLKWKKLNVEQLSNY